MNRYLAKPNEEETIMFHTEKLLIERNRLGILYPRLTENSELWDMLELVCIYHDFGKINKCFQKRMEDIISGKKTVGLLEGEFHHAILSMACLNLDILRRYFQKLYLKNEGKEISNITLEDKNKIKILYKRYSEEVYKAILCHHHRENLFDFDIKLIKEEVNLICEDYKNMISLIVNDKEQYPNLYQGIQFFEIAESEQKCTFDSGYYQAYTKDILDKDDFLRAKNYVFLKGLLNRIDYAASAGIEVEHPNDFLEEAMKNMGYHWNDLQKYMKANQEKNMIVVAQTGMGKTEAALLWIGNHKGFFTLPLRTAINSIYHRIKEQIIKNDNIDNRLGLLHSDSFEYYLNMYENSKENFKEKSKENSDLEQFDLDDYYIKTRQLSLPLTITTLDQLFVFVFRYAGYEEKLATMAYSKVVVDEVQMYGADLTAFLVIGLSMIQKMGGKFAILTATFPSFIKDLLTTEYVEFHDEIRKFTDSTLRHRVRFLHDGINSNFVYEKYTENQDKKILVICNTVRQCQIIYQELKEKLNLVEAELKSQNILERKLNLLHSKFIRKDRGDLEKAIFEFSNDKSKSGIWITTSIAEASLDIDFDVLITELSDINSLFQRMGRCFRRRALLDQGANCFVFDGGDGFCSGVGTVISQEIFCMSKEAIILKFGYSEAIDLSEEMKMNLVEEIYSTKNIKEKAPKYFRQIKDCMKKPESYFLNEMNKSEAYKNFRNILSETVIPLGIYEKYKEKITPLEALISDVKTPYKERVQSKQEILKYSLNLEIGYMDIRSRMKGEVLIAKNQEIKVVDFEYNDLIGLMRNSSKAEDKNKENIEDYFF